jgi:formyl-CoA transferase
VFCCNLSPAAVGRLGLAAADLVARHPRLVACQLTGYGDDGPYAARKAYDLLVQAEAGVLAVTGSGAEPAKAGISVADIAGGMYAYSSILAALLRRERTGQGDAITLSLFGALTEWMSQPLLLSSLTGRPPPRTGARHASIVPYGSYPTADGEEILIAVQNEAEWERLCRDVLGLPDVAADERYAGNPRRVERRDEVEGLLRPAVAALPTAELVRRLDRAQVAYASVKAVDQVVAHPQLAGRWMAVAAGGRQVAVLPPPASFAGFAAHPGDVPRLGEHTEAVLAELAEPAGDPARDPAGDSAADSAP